MKNLMVFDTEDDGKGNFIQGGVYDGNRFYLFESREEMGLFISSCRASFYTFNLEYDLVSLFWPDLASLRFWRSNGRILSARVGVASLFDLVWSMGGVGMAFCSALIGREKQTLDAKSVEYLKSDLLNTWAVLERLHQELDELGAGKPRGTLAGASLRVFKSFGGEISPFPPALETVVRDSYYGGRTECFDFRERLVDGFDVNSMFPAAMLAGTFPSGRYLSTRSVSNASFVKATVRIPMAHIPVLPYRSERLLFPVGTFTGTWAGEEIRYAIEQGAKIIKLHHAWRATEQVRPFDVFCSVLFERRRKDKFSNYYAKRIMNSLYGKLAQQGEIEYVTGTLISPSIKVLSPIPKDYNPSWPATITARARVMLHKFLMLADKDLLYCDTDSIFCSSKIAHLFPVGDGLGQLKHEHKNARMKVNAPKLYRLVENGEEYHRARGIPTRAGLNPAKEFFELGTAKYSRPLRLFEAIKRNMKPNVWAEMQKSFGADNFAKRKVLADGTTEPLTIRS